MNTTIAYLDFFSNHLDLIIEYGLSLCPSSFLSHETANASIETKLTYLTICLKIFFISHINFYCHKYSSVSDFRQTH